MKTVVTKLLLASLTLCSSFKAYAYEYSLTDLGKLGDSSKNIVNVMLGGLNDHGAISATIVNRSPNGQLTRHSVLWDSGVNQLNSLGGSSFAYGVNNNDQVVGVSYLSDEFYSHAVLWGNHTVRDLGTLGGHFSAAVDINNKQEIVGSSSTSGDLFNHATLWKDNKAIDLGSLYPNHSSKAASINDNGWIVGYSENVVNGRNATHATLWTDNSIVDLGTLGGMYSYANKINDQNEIIGYSSLGTPNSFQYHATLWSHGAIYDLGTIGNLSSQAYDINNTGLIVGKFFVNSNSNDSSAAIWKNREIFDLNTLINPDDGWHLTSASYINNDGQILGEGFYKGQSRFYLLSPIPEPSNFALMLVGIFSLVVFCRRAV